MKVTVVYIWAKSKKSLKLIRKDPFGVVALTVGGVLTTGGGAGAGGVGDRLGAVSVVEQ